MSHFSVSVRSTECQRHEGEKNKGGAGKDCGKWGNRTVQTENM